MAMAALQRALTWDLLHHACPHMYVKDSLQKEAFSDMMQSVLLTPASTPEASL